ncbi:MAG: S1C family serine protease, partial [Planctomycetota bacterium]
DGGPLLDGAGRLIGLLCLNLSDARWLGVAVPSDVLLDPLSKAVRTHSRARGTPARLTVVDSAGPPAFGAHQRRADALRRAMGAVAPSVVAIETVRHSDKSARLPRTRPIGPYAGIVKRPDAPVTGLIVGADGEILTSHFNIAGNLKSLHVILPDGRKLPARRMGWDAFRDLALLKVDARGLPAAELAAAKLPVGTPVAALGKSPDPAAVTMTTGIVSAAERFDATAMQIDARTNYGNAGGPVIDAAGRCVGLVAHVRTDGMWSQNSGVGFAVSAESIRSVLPRLRAGEVIARPKKGFLGVRTGSAGLDAGGVRVQAVLPNTGAHRAGLKARDVITHIDEQAVNEPRDLTRVILRRKPGDVVTLTVRRGKTVKKLRATLTQHPHR